MKLKIRILWISCIAVLLASLLGDTVIWIINAKSLKNEAVIQGYQNFYVVMNDLESVLEENERTEPDDIFLEYFFKIQNDDYNVCFRISGSSCDEIYNHTMLSAEKLMSLEYKTKNSAEYAELNLEGKHYLIFPGILQSDIQVYRIEDVTYVWEELRNLAVYILLITLGVTAAALVVLFLVLNRVLKPLKELNDTTMRLAEGLSHDVTGPDECHEQETNPYQWRVAIRRNDEIGQLGESFNKMAEAVEVRTRSLEESERHKTLFMGNLTHELKTPMTAISGYAQTLLSTKISPEDQEEALHYIYEECRRLERLSGKMMKLLELDQDGELEIRGVPARMLFEAAQKSCEVILKEKRITVETSEHGEIFTADPDLMTDVMINLIDNAVKASAAGQKIILKASENSIEVQDFGCGIPKEEQEKILEPFYMIDKSRSRKSGGAGLGLALTALILKRHHILLRIESEERKGTRMIMEFTHESE